MRHVFTSTSRTVLGILLELFPAVDVGKHVRVVDDAQETMQCVTVHKEAGLGLRDKQKKKRNEGFRRSADKRGKRGVTPVVEKVSTKQLQVNVHQKAISNTTSEVCLTWISYPMFLCHFDEARCARRECDDLILLHHGGGHEQPEAALAGGVVILELHLARGAHLVYVDAVLRGAFVEEVDDVNGCRLDSLKVAGQPARHQCGHSVTGRGGGRR